MVLQVNNSPFNQEQTELLNRLLPELTEPQRHWLSGYLQATATGTSVGAGSAVQNQVATAPAVAKEVTILYGTQTGNCQELAEGFTKQLEEQAYTVEVSAMNDFKPRDVKKLKNLLVIVSTHGEGDPPDNAIPFHEFLNGKRAPEVKELHYSVLSLGDSSYEFFCKTGQDFDEYFEKLGATRLADRVDCDLDFDDPAAEWFKEVFKSLEEVTGSPGQATADGVIPVQTTTSVYSRTNPFQAEVLENINLSGRGSNKENRHLELSIEDSGIEFLPGDSLGIYPKNKEQLVDELIAEMSWDKDQTVKIGKEGETSLREALHTYYEITVLTKPLLQKIAELTGNEEIKLILEDEDGQELRDYIYGRDLLDVLRDFSLQNLSAERVTEILRKMPARLYSIASSYQANPEEVHLLIGALRYESHDREREGVCSVHIAENIEPGDTLSVYVQKNDQFRLPENPETPIIMVGPGTGIAPFRSFIEERDEIDATGESWLFFGDQHYVTDFLYQVEWQRFLEDGALTKLDVAFSRDGEEKVYVQHKMQENGEELYNWLEKGAVFYVCGDEEYMAHDVHETLLKIIAEHGNKTPEEAEEYIQNLQQDKRYQRDVY